MPNVDFWTVLGYMIAGGLLAYGLIRMITSITGKPKRRHTRTAAVDHLGTALNNVLLERDEARKTAEMAIAERDKAVKGKDFYRQAYNDRTQHERADAALAERDEARSSRARAIAERNEARCKRDAALNERGQLLYERDAALAERDAALAERDAALAERDAASQELDETRTQRNNHRETCNIAAAKIETLRAAIIQRDVARHARDVANDVATHASVQRNEARAARDKALAERDTALTERDIARHANGALLNKDNERDDRAEAKRRKYLEQERELLRALHETQVCYERTLAERDEARTARDEARTARDNALALLSDSFRQCVQAEHDATMPEQHPTQS